MTASLGFTEPDKLEETLATVMANIINDVEMEDDYGILRHEEGIDLCPAISNYSVWRYLGKCHEQGACDAFLHRAGERQI